MGPGIPRKLGIPSIDAAVVSGGPLLAVVMRIYMTNTAVFLVRFAGIVSPVGIIVSGLYSANTTSE